MKKLIKNIFLATLMLPTEVDEKTNNYQDPPGFDNPINEGASSSDGIGAGE